MPREVDLQKRNDNIVEFRFQERAQRANDMSIDIDREMLDLLKGEIRDALDYKSLQNGYEIFEFHPVDIRSIEKERHFKMRFGFILGRRGRIAVVRFMMDYDLSSDDIRALYRLGSMTWNGTKLQLRYVFWLKLLGFANILALSAVLFPMIFLLVQRPDLNWGPKLTLIIFASAAAFGITWVHRQFIAPFNRLRNERKRR